MSRGGEICIVDDDAAMRDSLGALLGAYGFAVRSFGSGQTFLDAVRTLKADCILLDIQMSPPDGIEVLTRLGASGIDTPVVIMTAHGNVAIAVRAMQTGAFDFVEKPFAPEDLLARLRRAIEGGHLTRSRRARADSVRARLGRLTPRERDVFTHLAHGRANKVIARALGISPRTIQIHRARVMDKMEAENLADLVRMALDVGEAQD